MKPFTLALVLFLFVAGAGIALLSLSRHKLESGQLDILAIGAGLLGVALLVLAAVIFKAALKVGSETRQ
jgi:drug/metabolite transporter (DMT)-like permease